MKLAYRAFDKTGREVVDVIDAPSPAEAAEQLHRKDLFVADLTPTDAPEQASPAEGRPPPGTFEAPEAPGYVHAAALRAGAYGNAAGGGA